MSNKNKFPNVGVDEHTSPDGMDEAASEGSGWWSTRKTAVDGDTPVDPSPAASKPAKKKKWRTTATEEMENFKPVPVVGRLPWRTQYLICAIILVFSLGSLLVFSLMSSTSSASTSSAMVVRSSLESIEQSLSQVSMGQPPSSLNKAVLDNGTIAAKNMGQPISKMWSDIQPVAASLNQYVSLSSSVVTSAKKVDTALGQAIIAAAPLWRQSGEAGQWTSVEAVNFAQVLSEIQFLQDVAVRVGQGHAEIPERFTTARQNIEQSFRIFAASELAQQNTPLTQAWRALAGGFVAVKQDLDVMAGARTQWNTLQQAAAGFDARQQPLLSELSKTAQSTPVPKKTGVWFSGTFVFLALLFLIWINWKQQRWQVLEAQSSHERLQKNVEDLSHQLRGASSGNLTTRIRPADPFLHPLANLFNATIKSLQGLVLDVKKTADETEQAAFHANETAGVLVDSTRAQVQELSESGQEILSISHAVKNVSSMSQEAETMASSTIDAIAVGQDAVEDFRNRVSNIHEKIEDGTARVSRLKKSSSEILHISDMLSEVSQQISVLAIQATLQAAKAGEAGQGFRVVADGLKTLSERSGDEARRLGSLIEATLADIHAVLEALALVTQETEEGIRLGEVVQETSLMISQRMMQLQELVNQLHEVSSEQENTAELLATRTQNGLRNVEETSLKAQEAADALMILGNASSALKKSAVKFKV